MSAKARSAALLTIGWREWVALPSLEIAHIKVKVDTGARSSALHAHKLTIFEEAAQTWVHFIVHPLQESHTSSVDVTLPLHDMRMVKSSNGRSERRPVIRTDISLMGQRWPIDITLTRRDAMGFRMLLGRQALRGRFMVDVGRSFVAGT